MSEKPTSARPTEYPPSRPGMISYGIMALAIIGFGIFFMSQ
jgi:hypothetical protein